MLYLSVRTQFVALLFLCGSLVFSAFHAYHDVQLSTNSIPVLVGFFLVQTMHHVQILLCKTHAYLHPHHTQTQRQKFHNFFYAKYYEQTEAEEAEVAEEAARQTHTSKSTSSSSRNETITNDVITYTFDIAVAAASSSDDPSSAALSESIQKTSSPLSTEYIAFDYLLRKLSTLERQQLAATEAEDARLLAAAATTAASEPDAVARRRRASDEAFVHQSRHSVGLPLFFPLTTGCRLVTLTPATHGVPQPALYVYQHDTQRDPAHAPVLLHLHGGSHIAGGFLWHNGTMCHLSKQLGLPILFPEVRLAPEYPLPAAVDDAVATYDWLVNERLKAGNVQDAHNIALSGESAGGGLVLLTLQRLLQRKQAQAQAAAAEPAVRLPQGAVLLSPWLDISSVPAARSSMAYLKDDDVILTQPKLRRAATLAVRGYDYSKEVSDQDLQSPVYSPIYGSFEGLPPLFISCGTADLLLDDSRRAYQKAKEHNISVIYRESPHQMHVYQYFFDWFPEAHATMSVIRKWLSAKLNVVEP